MAVYHTQQCAEKALKGFLAWKGEEIDKTHYLPGLLTECAEFEPSFAGLSEAALRLNPYSSLYRYPHGGEGPGRLEAERALAFALEILDFAKERIAAPPPPPRQG
jgi:HEPN domain-containing protein